MGSVLPRILRIEPWIQDEIGKKSELMKAIGTEGSNSKVTQ